MNLAEVLSPMSPEQFFGEYWEKQPVLIRGTAGRFRGVFDSRDLGALLHTFRPSADAMLLVKGSKHSELEWLTPNRVPKPDKVRQAWRDGYSIIINDIGAHWPAAGDLAAALHEGLHHPVNLNLYLTPAGSQAFVPHFDTMDTIVLQVEGSKEWQVRAAASDLPFEDEHFTLIPDRLPPVLLEDTVRDGDVLYIPRGYAHAARATDTSSLHLTAGVQVVRWLDLLAAGVRALRSDSRMRHALPPGFLNGGADAISEAFTKIVAELPARATLDGALGQLAEQLVVKQIAPRADNLTGVDEESITGETTLVRRSGVICRVIEGDGFAGIQYSGGKIVGPPKIAQAVSRVAALRRFAVRELAGDLTEKETLVLVRRLVREGVLTIA